MVEVPRSLERESRYWVLDRFRGLFSELYLGMGDIFKHERVVFDVNKPKITRRIFSTIRTVEGEKLEITILYWRVKFEGRKYFAPNFGRACEAARIMGRKL